MSKHYPSSIKQFKNYFMKNIVKTLLLCSLGIVISCKSNPPSQTIGPNKLAKINVRKSIPLNSLEPRFFFPKHDSLIIISNYQGEKVLGRIININTGEKIGEFMEHGRKTNQLLSVFSAGMINNKMWVYDITGQRIVSCDLSVSPERKSSIYMTYPLNISYYWVAVDKFNNVYATGNEKQTSKIDIFNLNNQESISSIGNFNDMPTEYKSTPAIWRTGQQSFLYLRPDAKFAVLAGRFTDKIEIVDLTSQKSKIIRGPDNFEAEYTPIFQEIDTVFSFNNKSKHAFLGGSATQEYIYLLYKGDYHYKEDREVTKKVLIYNWEGNLIKCYIVPHGTAEVTSDDLNQTLYLYDRIKKNIQIAHLALK